MRDEPVTSPRDPSWSTSRAPEWMRAVFDTLVERQRRAEEACPVCEVFRALSGPDAKCRHHGGAA